MYLVNALNVIDEVKKAVIGKDACVERVMMAILAGGHILIEDIPGVGKTTMALAFSRACAMSQNRVQFTPDVLPADITGFSIYRKDTGRFEYQPGAVMCNLFLADEINRTSPKTQSALLEVMEEGNVTVDGVTRQVPRPFFVMATQNPIGSSGTQMLPESQLDRFMICISMGYPDIRNEIAILKDRSQGNPVDRIRPVIQVSDLLAMQEEVERIYIHDVLYNYIAELIALTRRHPMLELGVSPRGTIALTRMLKASAYLAGRNYVIPADVEKVFLTVNA
ncbi:MAG: MoxR family ATPase, partial [Firmicutes bacterium]|nr:MoxR family ATPase [Bacillota bacterium]